ncbi:MAG: pentapeptide repeat-containing protein [Phycisphaerales bacterium]
MIALHAPIATLASADVTANPEVARVMATLPVLSALFAILGVLTVLLALRRVKLPAEEQVREQLRALDMNQDVQQWNEWRNDHTRLSPIIVHANMDQAAIPGLDMSNMTVADSSFKGADLRGANFSNSKLYRDDFTDADLFKASFEGAKVHDVEFRNASISKEQLRKAKIYINNKKVDDIDSIIPDPIQELESAESIIKRVLSAKLPIEVVPGWYFEDLIFVAISGYCKDCSRLKTAHGVIMTASLEGDKYVVEARNYSPGNAVGAKPVTSAIRMARQFTEESSVRHGLLFASLTGFSDRAIYVVRENPDITVRLLDREWFFANLRRGYDEGALAKL